MDVNGGQLTQTNGNPVFPGSLFTGPLLAGNIFHSDGSGTLAGVGGSAGGTANVGYCEMSQAVVITQAASTGQSAGVFLTTIVIPAQSQITSMKLMVTTIWSGASVNLTVGNSVTAAAYTASAAVTGSGALGQQTITPGTSLTQIANWDNTGTVDVQILITSANTGTGVGTLSVSYIQGINQAS
jgi:hypothetical protein